MSGSSESTPQPIQVVVGLGNPGSDYAQTRHNVGFWFVQTLAEKKHATLSQTKKFFGNYTHIELEGHRLHVLQPTTFMNSSGRSVLAISRYFRIPSSAILVVQDELDFLPGIIKLKYGSSGKNSHNGITHIVSVLGKWFARLRIGIGRPDPQVEVKNYVLRSPSHQDQKSIRQAIDRGLQVLPFLVCGNWNEAVSSLHSHSADL